MLLAPSVLFENSYCDRLLLFDLDNRCLAKNRIRKGSFHKEVVLSRLDSIRLRIELDGSAGHVRSKRCVLNGKRQITAVLARWLVRHVMNVIDSQYAALR